MNCRRCDGAMNEEYVYGCDYTTPHSVVWMFRCLNCGNVEDRRVLANRRAQGASGLVYAPPAPSRRGRPVVRRGPRPSKHQKEWVFGAHDY